MLIQFLTKVNVLKHWLKKTNIKLGSSIVETNMTICKIMYNFKNISYNFSKYDYTLVKL